MPSAQHTELAQDRMAAEEVCCASIHASVGNVEDGKIIMRCGRASPEAAWGRPAGEDIRRLEGGVQIVSGTPGRVFDMIKRRVLQTRDIKILVLDEADEMLSKGFKEQIYDVYR